MLDRPTETVLAYTSSSAAVSQGPHFVGFFLLFLPGNGKWGAQEQPGFKEPQTYEPTKHSLAAALSHRGVC